ncbi:MAG: hypothetical protein ABIS01_11395 [Ferruginibacter sp.]
MKPLFVLLIAFILAVFSIKIFYHDYELALSAKIAMSVMLVFTAIAHFAFTKGMAMMIPGFIPFKKQLVYLTGIFEIAAAVGLLVPRLSLLTAWWLIVFFLCLLPANIYAAIKHLNYQKASYDGNGINYLWFRVPLQVFFIAWVYLSAIRII